MDNLCKDSDSYAYQLLRKWGIRYVLGEYIRKHERASQREHEEARSRGLVHAPPFDPDAFLDGQVKRVHRVGRYELFKGALRGVAAPRVGGAQRGAVRSCVEAPGAAGAARLAALEPPVARCRVPALSRSRALAAPPLPTPQSLGVRMTMTTRRV